MSTNILLILGMHRSGTSLFTNWLANCGLNVGDRLYPKALGNEKGHFEDLDFLELQVAILKENGYNWVFENGGDIITNTYWKEKAKSIVNFKNKLHRHWGWKEPRTCLFLDFWEDVIPQAHKIVVFRDYRAVVASLISRDVRRLDYIGGKLGYFRRTLARKKIHRDRDSIANKYLNTWCIYNERLIQQLEDDSDVLFVNIDEVDKMEKSIFHHLTNNLKFDLIEFDFGNVFSANLWRQQPYSGFIFDRELEQRAMRILAKLELLQTDRFNNM